MRTIVAVTAAALMYLAALGLLSQKSGILASESTAKPAVMFLAVVQDCESQGKVTICHNPNNNPPGVEICVAPQAVDAHLRNNARLGDYVGPCQPSTPTPTPTPTPDEIPTATPTLSRQELPTSTPHPNRRQRQLYPTPRPAVTPTPTPTPEPGVTPTSTPRPGQG